MASEGEENAALRARGQYCILNHAEPYACSREVEGGWVCDAQLELEKLKEIVRQALPYVDRAAHRTSASEPHELPSIVYRAMRTALDT